MIQQIYRLLPCELEYFCTPTDLCVLLCSVFSWICRPVKVAEQLCRLLTASPQEDLVTLVGGRLERLPLAIAALAEVSVTQK